MSTIVLNTDPYSPVEVSLAQRYIAENFMSALSNLDSNMSNIDKFQNDISKIYDFEEINYNISATNYTRILLEKNKDFMININSETEENVVVNIYGSSFSKTEELYKIFKKYQTINDEIYVKMKTFYIGKQGLEASVSYKEEKDFKNISKLYYPFLNTDELFKQFILSSDSILILGGKPGTGKTNIINLCLEYSILNSDLFFDEESEDVEEKYIQVAYIKNIDVLALDDFWNDITSNPPDFVVLDDIDFMLIDRNIEVNVSDEVRKKFISQLLSYTDGINENQTKFIITSNQDISSIDKAILRKGRCFDILQFRDLTKVEAKKIWVEYDLSEEDFDKQDFNDTVSACDLGSSIKLIKAMQENNHEKNNYVLEDNISIYSSSKNSKKSIKL